MPEGRWTLVLETSGRIGRLGLFDGPEAVELRSLDASRRNARDLVPTVAAMLAARHLTSRDLNRAIVGTGPGSYTGLRVGIVAAKTLAWSLSIPLYAVPAFASIAQRVPSDESPIVEAIADGLKGKVFCQRLRRSGSGSWETLEPLTVLPFDDWLGRIADGSAIATGPGVTTFESRLPPEVRRMPISMREAEPEGSMRLVEADPDRWLADLWTLEPLYVRGSYAEEAKKG